MRALKSWLANQLDKVYDVKLATKQRIGNSDSWWVDTSRLRNALVYSGGVGKDITFEIELASRFGCSVLLFDPSPTGIRTIKSTSLPSTVSFFPVGLAKSDGAVNFGAPINPLEGSFRVSKEAEFQFPCRSLHSLLVENSHSEIELLKIDIEGFEYEVIDDIIQNGLSIRQIAVEFHDFYPGIGRAATRSAIRKLKSKGYCMIHKRGHDYTFLKESTDG